MEQNFNSPVRDSTKLNKHFMQLSKLIKDEIDKKRYVIFVYFILTCQKFVESNTD